MSSSKSRAKNRSKKTPPKREIPAAPNSPAPAPGSLVPAPENLAATAPIAPPALERRVEEDVNGSSNGGHLAPLPPAPPLTRWRMGALGVMFVAIVLRQVQLGHAPFYPDENIHAYFSQGFDHYKYDPTFHGPVLYHLVSTIFALGGQSDYSARLVPSLLGIGLIWMVLGPARVWMGARPSLAAAALLAVSPSVVTYSRHLLHDALVLDLTMGAVLCFITALHYPAAQKRGRNAMMGLAACLSLFLATKANFFFLLVVIAAFWVAWLVRGKVRFNLPWARTWPLALFAVITLTAIRFPGTPPFKTPASDPQHRLFQMVAVLDCGLLLVWTLSRDMSEVETQARANWKKNRDWAAWILALAVAAWIYVFLFGQGAQIIGQWVTERQFPASTFTDGQSTAKGAIKKMLDYWGGQQTTPRLPGRHDYYVVLALLYEIPILVAALGGIWHAAKNRSVWSDFLLWWAFASWAVYALANEKVPWLLVHLALPLALLGGLWLATLNWKRPLFLALAGAGLIFSLRGDSAMIFERAGDHAEPLLYAQTPDAFRDAITRALVQTRGDGRSVWIDTERQWPSYWYLREKDNPPIGQSKVTLGVAASPFDPEKYRAFVAQDKDLAVWKARAGWRLETVDFLVWPRASWTALEPARFWRWFWTRETLSPQEWTGSPTNSPTSILAGNGEWSYQKTIVGSRIEP